MVEITMVCKKCLNSNCVCGYEYLYKSNLQMSKFVADIVQYRSKKSAIDILTLAIEIVKESKTFVIGE